MNRKAFTLLELLIVILIIAIIATLAVPQYMLYTEKARATEAISVIGAVRREFETQRMYGDRIDAEITQSRYWTYHSITDGRGPVLRFTIIARRRDGPYAASEIILAEDNDGIFTWSGDHPCVPE